MRRRAAALMTALALLTFAACGGASGGDFESLRAEVSAAGDINLSAEVTAAGETPETYSMSLSLSGGDCVITVSAPAALAGITARFDDSGEAWLEYDGLMLGAGRVNGAGLSAATALPLLVEAIRGAHVALTWEEGGESVVSLVPDDETGVAGIDLRLDPAGRPTGAEFISGGDGRVLISCDITEFSTSDTED